MCCAGLSRLAPTLPDLSRAARPSVDAEAVDAGRSTALLLRLLTVVVAILKVVLNNDPGRERQDAVLSDYLSTARTQVARGGICATSSSNQAQEHDSSPRPRDRDGDRGQAPSLEASCRSKMALPAGMDRWTGKTRVSTGWTRSETLRSNDDGPWSCCCHRAGAPASPKQK